MTQTTPAHRGSRHPAGLIAQIHRLQHTTIAGTASALRGVERQHIGSPDLLWRLATTVKNAFRSDVAARTLFGRHRPARNSRYTSTSGTQTTAASPPERSPEPARREPRMHGSSHRHKQLNPSRMSEKTWKITGITCRSGCIWRDHVALPGTMTAEATMGVLWRQRAAESGLVPCDGGRRK
jgi:hypothetical protein